MKDDLELYKTPHERLIELGWRLEHEDEDAVYYAKYFNVTIRIDKKEKVYYTTLRVIDLELAEIIVDYLKELENEKFSINKYR